MELNFLCISFMISNALLAKKLRTVLISDKKGSKKNRTKFLSVRKFYGTVKYSKTTLVSRNKPDIGQIYFTLFLVLETQSSQPQTS